MIKMLKAMDGFKTVALVGLALLFVGLDALYLKIFDNDVHGTIVFMALSFGGMRSISNGKVGFRRMIILAPLLLLTAGCGGIAAMHKDSTEAGTPAQGIAHIEEETRGLRFRVEAVEAPRVEAILGSENRFANLSFFHLGDEALYWEHVNQLGAGSSGASAEIVGRTLIRIDKSGHLGPLRQ